MSGKARLMDEEQALPAKKGLRPLALNYFKAFLVATLFVTGYLLVALVFLFFPATASPDYSKLFLSANFLFPAMLLLFLFKQNPFRTFRQEADFIKKPGPILALLPFSLALQITGAELETLARLLFPWEEEYRMLQDFLKPTGSAADIAGAFISMALVGPVVEEILIRRFVMDRLLHQGPYSLAVIFQALIFAALHMNPWQFFYTLPIGIIFGCARLWSGGIIFPTILHVTNNTIAVLGLYFFPDIPGLSQENQDSIAHVPAGLLIPAFSIVAICIAIFYKNRLAADDLTRTK